MNNYEVSARWRPCFLRRGARRPVRAARPARSGKEWRHLGDLVDDAQVAPEILTDEARTGLAPIVVGNICGGTYLAGGKAVTQRRMRNDANAQITRGRLMRRCTEQLR